MRVLSRRVGAAALFLAVLLAGRGSLAAESEVGPGTFRLFPPGMVPNPLLSPDPDPDPERSLLDTAVFLSEPDDPPVEEVRLDLHLPDAVLAVHAPPPTISLPVTRRSGLTGSLKTLTTGAIFAATIGFSAGNSLKETSYPGPYHFTAEGFFGQHTYTGGVDKMAHFVDYTIAQRALASAFRRTGYTDDLSGWMAFGGAFAGGLITEIGDGTTIFGFSFEDLLMDTLGAASATGLARSGWDDTIGFRFGAVAQDKTPSCCIDTSNIGRDYSGEIYTADLKLSGLFRRLNRDPGPARFLLFSVTYGTNGYNTASPDLRQRLVGVEIGIHFAEILREIGVPREPIWGGVLYFFFDTLRIPYTAIGVRYDLNHNEWFGPTAGHTAFPVSSGSR